ncbi:MAG: hypothetical protein OEV44_11055 [Spirochaetota bacterium]|nr:hypothetical protein [Spirochaetota bacterium]
MRKSLPILLVLLFFISFCTGSTVKPDLVIEKSPGTEPAWITGQKRKDSPGIQYYVGYGISNNKSDARKKAIRSVIEQISMRVMVEVYSIDTYGKNNSQIIDQNIKITSKSILFDLRIDQEYYQKKQSSSEESKTFYEYYIYSSYPSEKFSYARSQIIDFLNYQAKKALYAYEVAMTQINTDKISEGIMNLVDSKNILESLSFHRFPLRSKLYPKIRNNFILAGYVDRSINNIQSKLFLRKLNDKQNGVEGNLLSKALIVQAYYKGTKKRIPISGISITFYYKGKILSEKLTNEMGYADTNIKQEKKGQGTFIITAKGKYQFRGVSFTFAPHILNFTYTILPFIDIGIVLLEEKIDSKSQSNIISKTKLLDKLVNMLFSNKLKLKEYYIKEYNEKDLFQKAFRGTHSALQYFKTITGAKTIILCHLKSQFSSKMYNKFIFYRTDIKIKVIKGNNLETSFSEGVDRIKGGSISEEKAIFNSIKDAIDLLITKVKNKFPYI